MKQLRQCQPFDFNALPDCAFIRMHQLQALGLVPFSDVTAWRRVKEGTFPRPIRISSQVTAWRVGDVRGWLQDPLGYQAGAIINTARKYMGIV